MKTINQAIQDSIATDAIIYVDNTEENIDALYEACIDNVEANGILEFWGDDWRIHIDTRAEDEE